MKFDDKLDKQIKNIADLLKFKNKSYGNSALEPANIFSQANAIDSLSARIDDKLMRIKNKGIYDATEDTVKDLVGYLMLLLMALDEEKDSEYNSMRETIELGGHCNIDNTNISTIDDLNIFYNKDEDELN